MESKLWIKLSALLPLLVLPILASHDNDALPAATVAPQRSAVPTLDRAPMTPAAGSSVEETGQLDVSNNNTESSHGSSRNSTAVKKSIPLTPLIKAHKGPVMNSSTPVASLPVSENQTTHISPTSTTSSPKDKTDTLSVAMPTATAHLENTNASQPIIPVHSDPMTTTTTTTTPKPAHSTTTTPAMSKMSNTAVTTAVTTSATTSPTIITTQKSPRPPASKQNRTHSETSSESLVATTSPSAEAKAHANTPSQLNVGEGTTVVHDSPTLDPLLAGLVSAFIITAVIITLLLFLKLRRRDNRPEFRRLQDLPMDDMMEDTPLAMYSY